MTSDWRQILVCVRDRFLYLYAFYVVLGLSFVVLFAPAGNGPLPFAYADKLVHFGLFAGLALTAGWRWGRWRTIAIALLAYGLASEIIQGSLISGRQFDPVDVVADSAGLVVVLAAVSIGRYGREM